MGLIFCHFFLLNSDVLVGCLLKVIFVGRVLRFSRLVFEGTVVRLGVSYRLLLVDVC